MQAANRNREPTAMLAPPFSGIVCQRHHSAILEGDSMAERARNINLDFSLELFVPKIVLNFAWDSLP